MMDRQITLSPLTGDWLAVTSGLVGGTAYQDLHVYVKSEHYFKEKNLLYMNICNIWLASSIVSQNGSGLGTRLAFRGMEKIIASHPANNTTIILSSTEINGII